MESVNSTNGFLRGVIYAVMCDCVARISPFKHMILNGICNAFFIFGFFSVGCLQRTALLKRKMTCSLRRIYAERTIKLGTPELENSHPINGNEITGAKANILAVMPDCRVAPYFSGSPDKSESFFFSGKSFFHSSGAVVPAFSGGGVCL